MSIASHEDRRRKALDTLDQILEDLWLQEIPGDEQTLNIKDLDTFMFDSVPEENREAVGWFYWSKTTVLVED